MTLLNYLKVYKKTGTDAPSFSFLLCR